LVALSRISLTLAVDPTEGSRLCLSRPSACAGSESLVICTIAFVSAFSLSWLCVGFGITVAFLALRLGSDVIGRAKL
jgi:hypothetical protein